MKRILIWSAAIVSVIVIALTAAFIVNQNTLTMDEYFQATWDAQTESQKYQSCESADVIDAPFWDRVIDDVLMLEPDVMALQPSDQQILEFMRRECNN